MGTAQRLLVTRLAALVALAASVALLMAYLQPNSLVCGFESDCDEVLFSRFGKVGGVPLPVLGVSVFAVIFGLSLSPTLRSGRLLRGLALTASVGGLVLILLQVFVLHRLCPFCLIVDSAAVVMAYAVLGWRPDAGTPITVGRVRYLWVAAAVLALGCGAALGTAGSWMGTRQPMPVPPEISALWVPSKVTVVEIADFQCPHCRHMHSVIQRFLRDEGDRVHFVRLTAPMPKHPQARDASRAFLCAQTQGKGDEMAEALFEADDLTPKSCERIAASVSVSLTPFRACVADPATDRRLDADLAWVQKTTPQGLPVIWVQDQMLSGVQPKSALRAAVTAAEQRAAKSAR